MPPYPVPVLLLKVSTVAANSNRTWRVDLDHYTCTCPEKRIRTGRGYVAGQLGHVCPHMARAILDHLPEDAETFTLELRRWLSNPRNVHIYNLR